MKVMSSALLRGIIDAIPVWSVKIDHIFSLVFYDRFQRQDCDIVHLKFHWVNNICEDSDHGRMYHFETLTEVTLGRPQSGRSARFDCGAYRNESPFVLTYVASHNWLSLVESAFFEDAFNTYGLPIAAADYQLALQVIRGELPPPDANRLAETAYGYLHARYIFTAKGLKAMRRKFEAGVFGQCPRFRCDCQQLLPIGLASDMGRETAKVFCPRCRDIYDAETDLDGAAFGPSFPHFFLQMNRDIKFPHRAQQMRFDICGIQIEPTARLCPRRIVREKLDASE
jgi:casein kinase II subunit beta